MSNLITDMARAACEGSGCSCPTFTAHTNVIKCAIGESAMRAALAEAERQGWKLVPKEPTKAMRAAGSKEGNWSEHEDSIPREHREWVVGEWAADVYSAMLAASPEIDK